MGVIFNWGTGRNDSILVAAYVQQPFGRVFLIKNHNHTGSVKSLPMKVHSSLPKVASLQYWLQTISLAASQGTKEANRGLAVRLTFDDLLKHVGTTSFASLLLELNSFSDGLALQNWEC